MHRPPRKASPLTLALEPFGRAAFEALAPLEGALADPRKLALLIRQLGIEVTFTPEGLDQLAAPFQTLGQRAVNEVGRGRAALAIVADESNDLVERVEAVFEVLAVAKELVQVARDVSSA